MTKPSIIIISDFCIFCSYTFVIFVVRIDAMSYFKESTFICLYQKRCSNHFPDSCMYPPLHSLLFNELKIDRVINIIISDFWRFCSYVHCVVFMVMNEMLSCFKETKFICLYQNRHSLVIFLIVRLVGTLPCIHSYLMS